MMPSSRDERPITTTVKKLSKSTEVSGVGNVKSKRAQEVLKKLNTETREAWTELLTEKLFQFESEGGIELDNPDEKSFNITQSQIKEDIDLETSSKLLNFELSNGPYLLDVTDDGQYMVLSNKIGEVSMIELRTNRLIFEKNLMQYTRQIKCLFNEQFWAAIGKKYISIYDKNAVEIHCFKSETDSRLIDFLPYHALLVSWSIHNRIHFRDLTTGQIISTNKTRGARETKVLKQNPFSGVIYRGDTSGNINLHIPTSKEPCMTFHAHPSITSLAILDRYYCATGGLDNSWKIFDIRKANEAIFRYRTHGLPPRNMEASSTGILAVSTGQKVTLFKDVHREAQTFGNQNQLLEDQNHLNHLSGRRLQGGPYLHVNSRPGSLVSHMKFRPFEDILFMGLDTGIQTALVPGAGLANIDSKWNNPYATKGQKSSQLINRLLEKLPVESIRLGFQPPPELVKVYPSNT